MTRIRILFLLILPSFSFGQAYLDLYNQGVDALRENRLVAADSLLSLSIEMHVMNDALVNRAITNLFLGDTCRACQDLQISAVVHSDSEADSLYNTFCLIQSDTTFLDKKFRLVTSEQDYIYTEVLTNHRCDTVHEGTIHKRNHNSSYRIVIENGLPQKQLIDIYVLYFLTKSTKYYSYINNYDVPEINNERIKYFELRLKSYLNSKYDFSDITGNYKRLQLRCYFSKEGKLVSSEILYNPFKSYETDRKNEILSEIHQFVVENMPFLEPWRFRKETVSHRLDITFGL